MAGYLTKDTLITAAWLRARNACGEQVAISAREWPEGAYPTRENLRRAAELGLSVNWLAGGLPAAGREAYIVAERPLREALEAAVRLHWKAYETAERSHLAAYEAAERPLREAYEAAVADALADVLGVN